MITYNSPEHAKERQNVVPLTNDEMQQMIALLNRFENYATFPKGELQDLLHHHANLQHFYDVVGGWDGLRNLQFTADAYTIQDRDWSKDESESTGRNFYDELFGEIPRPTGIHAGGLGGWISVNNRLPEGETTDVYVHFGGMMMKAKYNDGNFLVENIIIHPKAWRPLHELNNKE